MRRRTEDKPRKRMSAEERKKRILETTVSFISQFGFWGFTIRDVAQAQNITEAGLLYYFKSKEQLLEETLKYADRINQIAIAKHLGVEDMTGEVLQDGIAYHCDLGLKAISIGTVETNASRPELVRLYTLLESEALSKDHPVHEYFKQRETSVLKEYEFAARRDGVPDPERTALQVLSAMDGLQLRWLNGSHDVDFVEEWKAIIDLLIP
jgi:TetR/AcrR family transcriptional regulator